MIKSKLHIYNGDQYIIINPKSFEFEKEQVFIKRFTVMGTKYINYDLTIEIISDYIKFTYHYVNPLYETNIFLMDFLKKFFETYKESIYLFIASNYKEIRDLARRHINDNAF
jgi:hypothetical protein